MNIDNELVVIIFRGAERILISIGGVISIWLGYKLFNKALPSNGSFDGGIGTWSIRMQNIAPGIFFALFGASALVFSITHPFTYESYWNTSTSPNQPNTETAFNNKNQSLGNLRSRSTGFGSSDAPNLFISNESDLLSALFIIDKYMKRPPSSLTIQQKEKIDSSIGILHNLQINLTDKVYGDGSLDKYQNMSLDIKNNKRALNDYSSKDRLLYEGIRNLYDQ